MSVVYQAPEPAPKHRCNYWPNLPVGSVIRCGECGTHWYRGRAWDDGSEYNPWMRVRWWNFAARRLAAGQPS